MSMTDKQTLKKNDDRPNVYTPHFVIQCHAVNVWHFAGPICA